MTPLSRANIAGSGKPSANAAQPRYVELVRVSGRAQHERDTQALQRAALDAMRDTHPGVLVARIEHDENISGALGLADRPDLQELRRLADAQAFDQLRVVHLNRLTRAASLRERVALFGILEDAGAVLMDTFGGAIDPKTPYGEMLWVMGTRATADDHRSILDRTLKGRMRAAAEGGKPSGRDPFGYVWKATRRGRGQWEIHEQQKAVVELMFELAAQGTSALRIAERLNLDGALSPRGNGWSRNSVLNALRSKLYLGDYTFRYKLNAQTFTIPVPPIITQDLWDRAQIGLVSRRNRPATGRRDEDMLPSLLRGHLTCGECGRSMHTYSARDRTRYYRCASRNRSTTRPGDLKPDPCSNGYHRMDAVDAAVWVEVERAINDSEAARKAATPTTVTESWSKQADAAEKRLAGIKKQEAATLKMMAQGLAEDACRERLVELAGQRKMTEQTLEVLRKNVADQQRAAQALASMDERLAVLRVALSKVQGHLDQRKLVLQIEGRAKVYADHQIEFEHMAGVNFES
ncbi:MAG: recombinase family protein [Myxococcales bacterium]|nr:recombinase family protein [Myxococcales bacterium]